VKVASWYVRKDEEVFVADIKEELVKVENRIKRLEIVLRSRLLLRVSYRWENDGYIFILHLQSK